MSPRDEALSLIEADPALAALLSEVTGRLDDDPGHDLEHCLRVAGWTLRCGSASVDPREALAAALLHDVVNVPKDDPRRAQASALSAEVAAELLPRFGFDAAAIGRTADAVRTHSFSRGETPRGPLGDALQDADRLEALGAIGLMRCISTGVRMGARYFEASDPFAAERVLDDRRYSLDHLYTKLLRLPDGFRTSVGRAEAERRARFLSLFADQLADELGRTGRPS